MLLVVGEIVRPHGIRGEVIVNVRTDEPDARFAVGSTLSTDPSAGAAGRPGPVGSAGGPVGAVGSAGPLARPAAGGAGPGAERSAVPAPADGRFVVPPTLTVESVRRHPQGRLIVAFGGIHDRNLAEELRGVLLWVDSGSIPAIDDPDEFHDHQLVGLAAVTPDGERLGEVVSVDHAPACDLLVLARPGGGTALVPFVKAIVPEVDLAGGRVVVTPPEGLLDL
jgi:16S rRNA processing protein RimM